MAIVIPSKNIYQKENPKVRDNVIERVEVNAVEVVPDNEYETPVESIILQDGFFSTAENSYIIGGSALMSGSGLYQSYNNAISYVSAMAKYNRCVVKIPLLKNNFYINSLLLGVDKDDKPNIKYNVSGTIKKGTATATIKRTGIEDTSVNIENIQKNEGIEEQTIFDIKSKIENPIEYGGVISIAKANATISVSEGNLKEIENAEIITENNIEYYQLTLTILCSVDNVKIGATGPYIYPANANTSYEGVGTYEEYTPTKLEITIYGNTIGIDLQDKTVYINGETQKKVHSFDGNELMQTTNYIKDTGEPAIEKMYGDTQLAYSRGKETATIRCSISDYYEENGEKKISIDKSTGRMSFKIGDKIIPMVYTSGGVDRAMSNYQDGSPKVFEVLGVRKYYDGAVWQELSSQEVAKNEEVSLFVNVNTGELFVSYADTAETAPIKFSIDSNNNLVAEIADGISGTLKLEDGNVILEK